MKTSVEICSWYKSWMLFFFIINSQIFTILQEEDNESKCPHPDGSLLSHNSQDLLSLFSFLSKVQPAEFITILTPSFGKWLAVTKSTHDLWLMGWHIQNRWSFHELSFEPHQQSSLSPAKPPSLTFWKGTALPKKSKHLIYLAANAKSRCHRRPGDLAVRSAAVTRWATWAPGFRKRQQRLGRTPLLDGTQVVSLNKAHPGHKTSRVQGAHSTERTTASPSDKPFTAAIDQWHWRSNWDLENSFTITQFQSAFKQVP